MEEKLFPPMKRQQIISLATIFIALGAITYAVVISGYVDNTKTERFMKGMAYGSAIGVVFLLIALLFTKNPNQADKTPD